MGDEDKNWTDQEMRNGWLQIPPELWDQPGTHIVGLCVGPTRESQVHGVAVHRGVSEDTTIFSRPERTEFVLVLKDGNLSMQAYDPKIHGELQVIPLMETPPAALLEQLYGDSGTQERSEGQQFNDERKKGASRGHRESNHHPKPLKR